MPLQVVLGRATYTIQLSPAASFNFLFNYLFIDSMVLGRNQLSMIRGSKFD